MQMDTYFADVHCHLLPGVDDGARTMEESLRLLRMEYEQGVRTVLLTPHYRRGYFETMRDTVQQRFEELKRCASEEGLQIELHLGCEFYRISEMQAMLDADSRFRIAGTKYVLLEFTPNDLPDTIWRHTGDLLIAGYRPVIAHAERYRALRDLTLVRRLVDAGAYLQVNGGSILGWNGFGTKRFCWKLIREQYVHLIGSDAHDPDRRIPCIGPCAAYLERKLGAEETRRLLMENPEAMLAGKYM